jgi:hypothetical protein
MDTQSELTSSDANKVESSSTTDQVMSSEEKNEKDDSQNVTVSSSSTTTIIATTTQDNVQTTSTTVPTTVIATRPQRVLTTQGHIEIAVSQGQDVSEDFEQYQITASGDDQNVYTYETTPNGIIIQSPPEHLPANIVKRDAIMIEKDHNGSATINVVNGEQQTVFVELKNDEQARYIPNAAIRYENPDRFPRYPFHHGIHNQHPPPPPHFAHHQREITLKTEQQGQQEIQIFENPTSNEQQNNIQEHGNDQQKTHYTNLEPVGSSQQSSYYISSSENYQPTSGNGFTYLTSQPSKESPYVYHSTGSPVLYKGEI